MGHGLAFHWSKGLWDCSDRGTTPSKSQAENQRGDAHQASSSMTTPGADFNAPRNAPSRR